MREWFGRAAAPIRPHGVMLIGGFSAQPARRPRGIAPGAPACAACAACTPAPHARTPAHGPRAGPRLARAPPERTRVPPERTHFVRQRGHFLPKNGRAAAEHGHSLPKNGRAAAEHGHSLPKNGRAAAEHGHSLPENGRAPPRLPALRGRVRPHWCRSGCTRARVASYRHLGEASQMKTTAARYAVGVRRPASTSRSSPVKRWTLKITLALLAGAVVTWGVAWGCALWAVRGETYMSNRFGGSSPEDGELERRFPPGLRAGWRRAEGEWVRSVQLGHGRGWEEGYYSVKRWTPSNTATAAAWGRYGWPALSLLWMETHAGFQGPELHAPSTLKPRVRGTKWLNGQKGRRLPLAIIPLGFALNTLLAAGVLLGVVEAFAFARRRGRRRKGRCTSCGYDRRGLVGDAAACPECGAAG